MSVKNTLVKARALIAKGWTKNTYARDQYGLMVEMRSPAACQFCITGALGLSVPTDDRDAYMNAYDALQNVRPLSSRFTGLVGFNDHPSTSQQDVLAVFDKAIEAQG
jgi:hypothetical protein